MRVVRGEEEQPQLEMFPAGEPESLDVGVDTEQIAAGVAAVALTEDQEQAVARRSEPLLVSAAAGSGKTSVLVERFVRAVREDQIAPARILAITFTERAAGELRARVRGRLLGLGDREAARDTEAAYVGTFHGFCARLLRSHPLAAGLDPDFAILDEGLAGRLRELAFKAALREFLSGERSEAVDLLAAFRVDRVRTMLEQAYRELRSRGQRLPRLPAAVLGDHAEELDVDAARACALLDELLARFGLAYERAKQRRAAVDFDDLELLARDLLAGHDGVRSAWAERFELLMVDEFQDTNPRQLEILSALERENLFTVGDEFQSIYGFRHADVRLFRARRDELQRHGGSLSLTVNFRGREPLLHVVNSVFVERFEGYSPLIAGRVDAAVGCDSSDVGEMAARGAAGAGPGAPEPLVELLLTCTDGWEEHEDLARDLADGLPHTQLWRQAEARMLAQRVAELVSGGHARAGEVVVLLRATGDLEVFERALQLQGLRTLAAVGAFWGHQQIGDLISYLRALANPLDELALYGVLASPLAGCSRDCLALLAQSSHAARRGAWDTVLAAEDREGGISKRLTTADRNALSGFRAYLQRERESASRRTISGLIERVVEARGYGDHVLGLDWGERRLANIHKLLRLARRFEAREGRDLRAFLDHVDYLRAAVTVEPDAPVEGVEPDAVRLMTVHASKGLEFPVLCIADLGRQPNTQMPGLLLEGERIGIRLERLDGARSKPALDYEELCTERRRREAEEEDRILYVAMTRARERLLLSGSIDFERWSHRDPPTPISWLAPALEEGLPQLAHDGRAAVHDAVVGSGPTATVRCRLNSPANVGTVLRASQPSVPPATPAGGELAPQGPALRARVSPRAVTPPRPSHERLSALSYTSLSELERCGYRYYVERVLQVAEDRGPARGSDRGEGLEARARGTLIHRLMESLDFGGHRSPAPEDVAVVAHELAMRVSERELQEIATLIARAGAAPVAARVAKAQTVRREHPFAFSLDSREPLITGVIDLLAAEADGRRLVVDYKSDRVGPQVDLEGLVDREYGIQRLLYALAALREGACEVEIVHWFLERPEQAVTVRHDAAERLELERRLAARISAAREQGFAVSPRPHRGLCLSCPARAGLCSWPESETLREEPESGPAAEGPPAEGL